MPLPTLRLPMASTSSLEFLGLTVSFCWTGVCCPAWVCSEVGCVLAGSGVGGGLCASTVPPAKVARSPSLSALPRVSFMVSASHFAFEYTPASYSLDELLSLRIRCQGLEEGFLRSVVAAACKRFPVSYGFLRPQSCTILRTRIPCGFYATS